MPDTVKVKIENLQKVCTEYSNQKRQKVDSTDDSTTYNTVDLYGNNEHAGLPPDTMLTITEPQEALEDNASEKGTTKPDGAVITPESENAIDLTAILAEEEFIPIGSRGKVH